MFPRQSCQASCTRNDVSDDCADVVSFLSIMKKVAVENDMY